MTWKCGNCSALGNDDGDLEYLNIGNSEVAARCPKCHRPIKIMLVRDLGHGQFSVTERSP